jgi:hypothetical protein
MLVAMGQVVGRQVRDPLTSTRATVSVGLETWLGGYEDAAQNAFQFRVVVFPFHSFVDDKNGGIPPACPSTFLTFHTLNECEPEITTEFAFSCGFVWLKMGISGGSCDYRNEYPVSYKTGNLLIT